MNDKNIIDTITNVFVFDDYNNLPDYCKVGSIISMNPLERQFFRYCMKQLSYQNINFHAKPIYVYTIMPMRNIIEDFSTSKKVNPNKLRKYVEKWYHKYGFYDFGSSLNHGWFYLNKLPHHYVESIPRRTLCKLNEALFVTKY